VLSGVLDRPFIGTSGLNDATGSESEGEAVEGGAEVPRAGRRRRRRRLIHALRLSAISVAPIDDFLDFENLLPEMILALGLALLIGNGLAWWKHRRGETPRGVEQAQYRRGRVIFLSVVGVVLAVWGGVTLLG
jgi:hypothetical protein